MAHGLSVSPEQCPALVLNADYQPLSYFPLSLWSWQDAVKAIFRGSVTVLSEYEREVHSPSCAMKLPSVLVLKDYVPGQHKPAFTRFNVFLRDGFCCQYCGHEFKASALTFDHVIPRARGGQTSWDNIVAACKDCNLKKGAKMPRDCGMIPLTPPQAPRLKDLQKQGKKFPPNFLHESWGDFLYWDTALDEG